jgi:hypothetical protein
LKQGDLILKFRIEELFSDQTKDQQFIVQDPENPIGFYVYGHYDENDKLFYVGKGKGKRAWSRRNRHCYWERYVEKNLTGEYKVKIIADNLSDREAQILENRIMADNASQIVNWINWERDEDFELGDKRNAFWKKNRQLIEEARQLEKSNLELAVKTYKKAIAAIAEYSFIVDLGGLLGQLIREEREELGYRGEFVAIDRLTLCLKKLGRIEEAAAEADAYFDKYRGDLALKAAENVQRRVAEGRNK